MNEKTQNMLHYIPNGCRNCHSDMFFRVTKNWAGANKWVCTKCASFNLFRHDMPLKDKYVDVDGILLVHQEENLR